MIVDNEYIDEIQNKNLFQFLNYCSANNIQLVNRYGNISENKVKYAAYDYIKLYNEINSSPNAFTLRNFINKKSLEKVLFDSGFDENSISINSIKPNNVQYKGRNILLRK